MIGKMLNCGKEVPNSFLIIILSQKGNVMKSENGILFAQGGPNTQVETFHP
jgi:hypothetical protein